MVARLLSLLLGSALSGIVPASLDDPARQVTEVLPEARVLAAATDRRAARPTRVRETLGPAVSADAYVVLDLGTGAVLTAQNPSAVRPVASLTKLLTALTVVEHAEPEAVVTVSARAARAALSGADMRLRAGERLTVRDLLAGLLIPSANDAAVALAEHVSGSEAVFAGAMNAVASRLGLTRTHVVNATGLDHSEHFSSPYDMALLLAAVWQHPLLGPFLRAESLDVTSREGRVHHLKTTNRLLGQRTDILAGKTGFTAAAGQSLAVVAEDDRGHPVVAVLLGSADRFGDMNTVLNWAFWAYAWPDDASGGEETP